MPILGLVLQLDDAGAATARRVGAALRGEPGLDLGEPSAHRWPAVLEAPSERAAEERIDGLRGVPGVAGVDVVYADFEDLLAPPSSRDAREER